MCEQSACRAKFGSSLLFEWRARLDGPSDEDTSSHLADKGSLCAVMSNECMLMVESRSSGRVACLPVGMLLVSALYPNGQGIDQVRKLCS